MRFSKSKKLIYGKKRKNQFFEVVHRFVGFPIPGKIGWGKMVQNCSSWESFIELNSEMVKSLKKLKTHQPNQKQSL